ncbi:MAG: mercury(II) reductase [Actinobacteria bacterium]|nr:mercury(II) reductase [Actinomycetota bacterium]MCL6105414.1 mercury(II) reductase [Actinomycetota bacterium]
MAPEKDDIKAEKAVLEVRGMTCDDCEHHVSKALLAVGARDVYADRSVNAAFFTLPQGIEEETLKQAVKQAGYLPGELKKERGKNLKAKGGKLLSETNNSYDLLVIGSGSAAFAAGIKASDLGAKVALVEEKTIGGTCVNIGCVPSKALLKPAEVYWAAAHHRFPGISTSQGDVDLAMLIFEKDSLVTALRQTKYLDVAKSYDFEIKQGHASFVGEDRVEINGEPVSANKILIATGASPFVPPIPGLDKSGYLTSTTALELKELPDRLIVIGANAIGLELGQFFLHLGSKVTFIDIASRIAPFEEPEISAALGDALLREGAEIITSAQISSCEKSADGLVEVKVTGEVNETCLVADHILVATGRRPNTDSLGLDLSGIEVDQRGAVVVDEQLHTTNPLVWAAGDVTPSPQFVYVAAYEGALAAENALLELSENTASPRKVDFTALPRVIFSSPQVASAGLTQEQAVANGYEVKTSLLPLEAVPRALANRDTTGVVKLVADAKTDRLLGASMVADGASDVIQAAVVAIKVGLTTTELASMFHPYLTMSEGLKLAAQTFEKDVSKLSCCA